MKMDIETVASELRLDRSNWSLTTFGEVAIQQKESVDRENTDITRYVKGEHMYSEDIHLREWGELKDEYLGPAFIRRFEKGDILYGSRRTYLRKVCIAPFEGITSNTTFVIKANEELIDNRLLPFLMLSEGFSEHSIRNSKGSVNPYVNWKDLASYEFLLPPKDQQAQLVELLGTGDDFICSLREVKISYEAYKSAFLNKLFLEEIDSNSVSNWSELGSCCQKITYGFTNPMPTVDDGVYMVTATNIREGRVDFENTRNTSLDAYNNLITPKSRPIKGDILLTKDGRLGELAIVGEEQMCINQSVALLRTNGNITSEYIYYALQSPFFQDLMLRGAGGTTIKHIYITKIAKMKIPVPTLQRQVQISEKASSIFDRQTEIDKCIEVVKLLQKSLINQVF